MCRRRLQLALLLVPLLTLAACGGNSGAEWGPGSTQGNASTRHISQQGGLIILASPNLQRVLPALADTFFAARRLTLPYVFNFSAAQINAISANALAAADLFIADDRQTMLDAHATGFTQSEGTPLASDFLSVVLPSGNPGNIRTLQDLARPGLHYLGISSQDGLSRHIQGTLERMMLDPAFGPSYPARVYGNLFKNYTDGPAATRALVTSPPAGDFAMVYHTNYLTAQQERGAGALRELSIPALFNPPIATFATITTRAANPSLSRQFIDFMRSPQGQTIWKHYGFQPAT